MLEITEPLTTLKNNQCVSIPITEGCHIAAARREAIEMAHNFGFPQTAIDKLAIIISELGSNLIKHADKNKLRQLLLRYTQSAQQDIFEIFALDKGPGIINLAQCLQDGYSSTNTAGTGLGAIARLSDYLNFYSLPELGSIVSTGIYFEKNKPKPPLPISLEISGICLPIVGEKISGDNWAYHESTDRYLVMVADGLGHGPHAAHASQLACEVFQKNVLRSPAEIIENINAALFRTRGAAVAIAEINKQEQLVKFAGLGNISGHIYTDKKTHHMVTHDGTAGMRQYKAQEYTYPWNNNALLVMHSDGLLSRWTLDQYPGLATRHPALISSVLYRDFCRGNDDITVVIAKDKNINHFNE